MSEPELALLVEGFEPTRGGAERAVRAVAEALIAEGRSVWVYAPAQRTGPELPAPGRVVPVEVGTGPRPLWALRLASALTRAAERDGAERIVSCGKLLGAHGWWPHSGLQAISRAVSADAKRNERARWLARVGRALRPSERSYDWIEGRALSACRRGSLTPIALSERIRADLVARGGLDPASVRIVRNGVDHDRFTPPDEQTRGDARRALARRIGARGDSAIALLVAHSFHLKGLDTLLRAAGEVRGVHLAIAGGGDPRPFLELAHGMNLGQRLTFLGPVGDVRPLYRGATFLAHPSRYDPCSLVVLEALASGLPVIGSTADGASELIVEGETGYVVPPEDTDALMTRLEQMLVPSERKRLSETAATFRRPWSQVGAELLTAVG